MVLVATVALGTISLAQPKLWNVPLNLILTDKGVKVIDKDYIIPYRPDDTVSEKPAAKITAEMQADIKTYKATQTIVSNAEIKTLAATVQEGLVV